MKTISEAHHWVPRGLTTQFSNLTYLQSPWASDWCVFYYTATSLHKAFLQNLLWNLAATLTASQLVKVISYLHSLFWRQPMIDYSTHTGNCHIPSKSHSEVLQQLLLIDFFTECLLMIQLSETPQSDISKGPTTTSSLQPVHNPRFIPMNSKDSFLGRTYTPNSSDPRCRAGLKGLTSATSSPCNSIESCVPTLAHHACTTLPSHQTIEPLIYDLFILLQCYRLTSLKEWQFPLNWLSRGNFTA
jgi:hypothetical protein